MATPRSLDSAPLIGIRRPRFLRLPTLRGIARFLRRAGNRRAMREPSMMVRESAVQQLEGRHNDWARSRPIVVLDMLWNLAFISVAIAGMMLTEMTRADMPLRIWLVGYVLLCVAHMVAVGREYRKRTAPGAENLPQDEETDDGNGFGYVGFVNREYNSVARFIESTNRMSSLIWWILGFYWVSGGGSEMTHDSPKLYWLCIVFLAFDVFLVLFCASIALMIGVAMCCCLPLIIAILYAVADQEGASDEEINQLPKYKFCSTSVSAKLEDEISGPSGGLLIECGTNAPLHHELSSENAECCICLSDYEDGAELRQLPCNHYFHCTCIDKWLRMNATCPLCKYDILRTNNDAAEEV